MDIAGNVEQPGRVILNLGGQNIVANAMPIYIHVVDVSIMIFSIDPGRSCIRQLYPPSSVE